MPNKILISGEIGWDVQPADVRRQLEAAKGGDIDIHIASPGGFIFDGLEIFNLIRDYKRDNLQSKVNMYIKGLAASMASYIAAVPVVDRVYAEDNAAFMIHNAWITIAGDSKQLSKTAEMLNGLDSMLNKAYAERTGKSREEIQKLCDDETWFFGSEMLEAGFVDEIIEAENPNSEKDKAAALATYKMKVSHVLNKVKKNSATDLLKAAAMLQQPGNSHLATLGDTGRGHDISSLTLAEIKNGNPGLYNSLLAQVREEMRSPSHNVKNLIEIRRQFKGSPLFEGIDSIIEEGIAKGLTPEAVIFAIAKWTSGGSAVASLETIEHIGTTGANASASGEQAGNYEKRWE